MAALALAFDLLAHDKISPAFDSASESADGFVGKMKGLGKKIGPLALAGGAAIGAGLVAGFGEFLSRDALNDKLAAQLDLSADESAKFGKIAGDLYADAYGDSMEEVYSAIGAVQSTLGDALGGDEIEGATTKALDLATAFDLDVSRAVSSVGVLLSSGLVKDADEAFDLIAASMQQMPAHMREELLEATDEYGQFFKGLGIDATEAFGLLVDASEDGMYGIDKTGDAIKELSIRATDMSTASSGAFAAAGLDAGVMAERFLAGGGTARGALDDLIEGLLAIEDPVARSNAAIALFGTPLEDLGVNEIPTFLTSLQNMGLGLGDVEGAAIELGDTLNNNAAVTIESFKRKALGTLVDFIGGKVIPMIESLSTWIGENTDVIAAAAIGITIVFVPALYAWAAAAGAAGLATLLAAGPVVALGVAVGGAALVIIKNWDLIKSAFIAVFNWVKDNWPLLLGILTAPIGAAVWLIVDHGGAILTFFKELPGNIVSALGDLTRLLFDKGKDLVRGIIDGIKSAAGGIASAIADSIPGGGAIGRAARGIGGIIGGIFDDGGVVPGAIGSPQLVLAHGGETILPTHKPGGGIDQSEVVAKLNELIAVVNRQTDWNVRIARAG